MVVTLGQQYNVVVIRMSLKEYVWSNHIYRVNNRVLYGSTAGEVANPARGQLNREHEYFPFPVRAWEFAVPSRISLIISNTQAEYGG